MLKEVSNNIANHIGKELQSDSEDIDVYRYGLEIIIGSIIKLTVVILLSILLGTFDTTMICIITFVIFRVLAGGVHLNTYFRCLSLSIILFLIIGKIALIGISAIILKIFLVTVILLGLYCAYKYVPAGTEKRVISNKRRIFKAKIETLLLIIIWSIIIIQLIKSQFYQYAFASILGSFMSLIFVTRLGYILINKIDSLISNIKNHAQRR